MPNNSGKFFQRLNFQVICTLITLLKWNQPISLSTKRYYISSVSVRQITAVHTESLVEGYFYDFLILQDGIILKVLHKIFSEFVFTL